MRNVKSAKSLLREFCKKNKGKIVTQKTIREYALEGLGTLGVDHQNIVDIMMDLGFVQIPNQNPEILAPFVYKVPRQPGKTKTKIKSGTGKFITYGTRSKID